ncbi:MAG TPA: hypothetical protein VHK91_04825 [Flavisolibacter sp.]|jgi:hypothetical protein|nr:hypothetical protein [Flavisolibacter sp.]
MTTSSLSDGSTKAGTFGGTLLVLFLQLDPAHMAESALIAFIGAVVSFFTSRLLKWIFRRRKN